MKVHYLSFAQSDMTKSGSVWTTPVIDLYYNSQYKNYSITKSSYGLDSLGDRTWTGKTLLDGSHTDYGILENSRFIDTTARITIPTWRATIDYGYDYDIGVVLSAYTSYTSDNTGNLSEWSIRDGIDSNTVPVFNEAERYVFFQLHFDTTIDISSANVQLFIRVEIDSPAINALYPETIRVQNKFPEWMAIREYDPQDPLGQNRTEPSSIGGKFINAVAGEWLTELKNSVNYQQFQHFIETVDLGQRAWVYQTSDVPTIITSVTGDGVALAVANNLQEFYDAGNNQDVLLWNEDTSNLYTIKKYNTLLINGEAVDQGLYQVWNSIDDIGLSVDLFRLRHESNEFFRLRIIDVYKNRPGVSKQAFQNALRRELNLWKFYSGTPDSNYSGATPEILEMSDIEHDPLYFTSAGLPTQKFKDLAQKLAETYPISWGFFQNGSGFWDLDGLDNKGISIIPRQFDATPVSEQYLQSGVGDGNDLYLFKPNEYTGAQTFDFKFSVRGRQKTTRTEYPGLTFDVDIQGFANTNSSTNLYNDFNFTVELTIGGVVYYNNIILNAKSDVTYYEATPTEKSYATYYWLNQSLLTDANTTYKHKVTDAVYASTIPNQISYTNITTVKLVPGSWSKATQTYTNVPNQADYKLRFSDSFINDTTNLLGLTGSAVSIQFLTSTGRMPYIVLQSFKTATIGVVTNGYQSDHFTFKVNLNGANPATSKVPYTLALPVIPWPANVVSNSRYYTVAIKSGTTSSVFGAFSTEQSATPIFVPISNIALNGISTWTLGKQTVLVSAASSFVFSTIDNATYPVSVPVWSLFEKEQTVAAYTGTLDENGPWRNNTPPFYGNTNFLLDYYSLSRNTFTLPNTTSYIINWIGITSVSNSNVLVWLESNSIKPAVSDAGETAIPAAPANASIESLSGGVYSFSPITVKARLKPGVNEKWYPKVYSGYFYDDVDEYYLYANKRLESATSNTKVLQGVNRLGAPIIVQGIKGGTPIYDTRQVTFWEDDATPTLSLTNTQFIDGNGYNKLYAAYDDIYNITVVDVATNTSITPVNSSTKTNIISLPIVTDRTHSYKIQYKVRKSFYVDNEYIEASPSFANKTKIVFDASPSVYSASSYNVYYETSIYDPATPIDVPLNTFYTSIDEGFIFIDHDIHSLDKVEFKMSPAALRADGLDYALVTLRTYDQFGNPKPNQTYNLYTNFGTLSSAIVTTDRDGFAYTMLTSETWKSTLNPFPATPGIVKATPNVNGGRGGLLKAVGPINATANYSIFTQATPEYTLTSVPSVDTLAADGISKVYVYGKVENSNHIPTSGAVVYWKKHRYLYNLFGTAKSESLATPGKTGASGKVLTDASGRFTVGPFIAATPFNPGFWLVSVESEYTQATPNGTITNRYAPIGDVVYWNEFTDTNFGVDTITGIPRAPAQFATPYWTIPKYTTSNAYPVTFDETAYQAGIQNPGIVWQPPKWYAVSKYQQYQMKLLGNGYWTYSQGATPNTYSDYKEY